VSAESRCPQCDSGAVTLSELLEGTLPPPQREELEGHLAGCADCRALLESLREQIETCRRTPRPEPSRDCVARAVEALQAELIRRRQRAP
jgi:anti-sigma factor RsiW